MAGNRRSANLAEDLDVTAMLAIQQMPAFLFDDWVVATTRVRIQWNAEGDKGGPFPTDQPSVKGAVARFFLKNAEVAGSA